MPQPRRITRAGTAGGHNVIPLEILPIASFSGAHSRGGISGAVLAPAGAAAVPGAAWWSCLPAADVPPGLRAGLREGHVPACPLFRLLPAWDGGAADGRRVVPSQLRTPRGWARP